MSILLAGDVGGTKTILRLVRTAAGGAPEVLHEERYRSKEHPDLVPIVHRFLDAAAVELAEPPAVSAACFGVAGPVVGDTSELTNLSWSLSASRLARELDIPRVRLINDFEAIGHGIPELAETDLRTLQPGRPERAAPVAVIGAGTGLGQAFLIPGPNGADHRVFCTEGGHSDFSPQSELEIGLLRYLRQAMDLPHISVERVVSGRGIASIYEFLRIREPSLETPAMAEVYTTWQREIGRERRSVDIAAEVSGAAIAGDDPLSEQAMRLFVAAYGGEAGSLALKILPMGASTSPAALPPRSCR